MERITGVAADDAVGLPYNELLAGRDHDGKLVRLEDLLAAATPETPSVNPGWLVGLLLGGRLVLPRRGE